jgi:hypothetical protein
MGVRMVHTIDTPRMGMSAVKEMHLTESNSTITMATITNKRKSAPHTPPALNTGALLPHKSMVMRFTVEVCTLMADLTRPKVAMRMIGDQVLMRERGEELNTLLVLMREEKEEDLSTLLGLMMCRCHLTLLALMILPMLQVIMEVLHINTHHMLQLHMHQPQVTALEQKRWEVLRGGRFLDKS